MTPPPETPSHIKLTQDKAAWDAKQKEKRASAAQGVVITGIDIPFFDLVTFMVKAAIAAVPAAVIVTIFWTIVAGFLGGMLR